MSAALIVGLVGCQSTAPSAGVGTNPQPRLDAPVEVWLTTGDQRVLFARQPNIVAGDNTGKISSPTIDIDDRQRFQEMIGFGAALTDASAFLIQNRMSGLDRERLLQDLFGRDSGVGFSFVRVPMGASDFSSRHYTYDDLPPSQTDSTLSHFSVAADRADKLPLLRKALTINPQLKVVASPWSPPAWMKTTNSLIKGTLRQEFYDSFANYFVKFIRAYASERVPIYAITIQNEPNFEPDSYPGMHLDAATRATLISGQLGPAFEREGIKTLIWDWDHNWDLPQQPLGVLADSTARRYVQGVAWHCYGGEVNAQSTVHDRYPDKDAYFTECSGGEWSPKFDENLKWTTANLVIGAPRNWARGVLLWNLALDENHGPHLGGCNNCRGIVTIDSKTGAYKREVEYYSLAHASKFVRPGAYRIASRGGEPDLTNVAFRNTDGQLVLIVLNGGATDQAFAVRSGARTFNYQLQPSSVATFIWTN